MTATPPFYRVAVFVDHANINRSANDKQIQIDYRAFLDYLVAGRHLVEAITHVPVDPRNPHAMDQEIEDLWLARYLVKPKTGKIQGETYKCNVDVEMTIDMLNAGLDMNIDTVILVSGDGDFLPVVEYLRGRGIRVEVCGFVDNMARELILKSSDFIDAEVYFYQNQSEEFNDD